MEFGRAAHAAQDAFIGGAERFRVTSDDDVTVNSVGVAYDDQLLINDGSTLTATDGTVLGADDQGHSYGIDGIVYVGSTFDLFDRRRAGQFRDGRLLGATPGRAAAR